jgi:hypothetical protein
MIIKTFLTLLLSLSLHAIEFDIFEFSVHGNFCGKNIPDFDFKNRQEEVELLQKLPAIDIIDEACKKHDICYSQRGEHNLACDNELVAEIQTIKKRLTQKNCKILAKAIITYFDLVNHNPITVIESGGSVRKKITDVPTAGMENMFDMASFGGDMMINYSYAKPVDYIFDSKNNKQRRHEILQLLPPKDQKCEVK